ncbi:MAG: SGNH/GDSL hydrolase family protein [Ruminococcaceae bacterium]|nr:SGNH/GDSL hydrolase family protein [Oscillospiraceae bacterium]
MNFKKIDIYGDSILRGVMYDEESASYKLRDGYKLECFSSRGIEIRNNSRIGATIEKGKDALERKLQDCDSSTLVILEYGGNDCDYEWKNVSDAPLAEHTPHIEPQKFIDTYKQAIATAMKKGATVAITSLVPIDSGKYMKWISRNLSYDNILNWLGDESMLFRWQEYYSHLVESIARELKCEFIDLRREFLLSHSFPKLLCADGIHPTQAGHELIEKALCRFVC